MYTYIWTSITFEFTTTVRLNDGLDLNKTGSFLFTLDLKKAKTTLISQTLIRLVQQNQLDLNKSKMESRKLPNSILIRLDQIIKLGWTSIISKLMTLILIRSYHNC